MVDTLTAFRGPHDREVVPLYRPTPGVAVDLEIRGGYPVIAETRVPYDMVASLLEDEVTAEEVAGFYPAVSADAARGALAFARYVDGYRSRSALDRAMKLLLDEDVPVQLVEPLRRLLRGHQVDHVRRSWVEGEEGPFPASRCQRQGLPRSAHE